MRNLLPLVVLILTACSLFGQQPLRTALTTNQMMNLPQDGWIAIWNNIAKKWSNGVNTASATNDAQPPSTVLSNLTATGVAPGATNASAYIASATGLGTNTEIRTKFTVNGDLESTNGNVVLGHFGDPRLMTNYNHQYQRAQMTFNDSGNLLRISDGAFIDLRSGSAIILGADGNVNRVQMHDGNYITSPTGASDNNEIFRYRFWGDTDASAVTNRVQRWWEVSNYVAAISFGSGVPAGNSGAIQFNEGGLFDGTNLLVFDRTNGFVGIGTPDPSSILHVTSAAPVITIQSAAATAAFKVDGIGTTTDQTFNIRINSLTIPKWQFGDSLVEYAFAPATTNSQDIGRFIAPVRTNYANDFVAMETVSVQGGTAGGLTLFDNDASHGIKLLSPATLSSNINLTFPTGVSNGVVTISSVNDSNFTIVVVPSSSIGGTNVATFASGYATLGGATITNQFKQTRQTVSYAGGSTNAHVDLSLGNKFLLTLTKNTHIVFTNISDSVAGSIQTVQDSTGGWLVSYNTNFAKSTAGLFSGNTTNATAIDIISFESLSGGTAVGIVQTLDIR